jgi:hypothetical protein
MKIKSKYITSIIIFIILFIASYYLIGRHNAHISARDGTIIISAGDDFYLEIPPDNVESAQLVTSLPIGDCINGYSNWGTTYGTYYNDEIGKFYICVSDRISQYVYVILKDNTSIYFNYESESVTSQLCDALNS